MHSVLCDASESQTFAVFPWDFFDLVDVLDTPILRNASVSQTFAVFSVVPLLVYRA